MSRMWLLLLGLLGLLGGVLGASQRQLEHRLSLGAANELYEQQRIDHDNDHDNDHGNDNDYDYDSDSDSDSDKDTGNTWMQRSPPVAVHVPQLRRVPRQPQHLGHDNRLDDSAAFDEADYQSDQAPGVLTAQKQQEVGSPDTVQSSRRHYQAQSRNATLAQMANLHKRRMDNEVLCRQPQERVIRMRKETSKVYVPQYTILHRCDENSSCCPSTAVWTAKSKATVELVFWVQSVGSQTHAQVVALTNHTECHCLHREAQRRRRSPHCQCPKHFSNFGGAPSSCRCDCHLSDTTCQRMKNGDEGFAVSELKCIRSYACSPPICNYGLFNSDLGRCPRPTQSQQRQLGFG